MCSSSQMKHNSTETKLPRHYVQMLHGSFQSGWDERKYQHFREIL